MEIKNVQTVKKNLTVSEMFKVQFKIIGALYPFFEFPLANESLTKPIIEFDKEN